MIADTFKRANASDRYRANFYDGGHKFDLAMQKDAFEWFDRFLKAGPANKQVPANRSARSQSKGAEGRN